MVTLLERRPRIDPRHRQGLALVTLIYVIGWSLGRASGKLEATERLLSARAPR